MDATLHDKFARFTSGVMYAVCVIFTLLILTVLALVIGYLVSIGGSAFYDQVEGRVDLSFFTELPTGRHDDPGGMRHAIAGTAVLVGLASLVGIPVGMLAGVYLAEYDAGSWIASPVRFIADVLAGVPSIVVGVLGYELLVVPFSTGEVLGVPVPGIHRLGISGYNGYAGALALAFIMIPIVTRTTEEMLRLVPNSYREASMALGASKAGTILKVVVPSATGSIVTGVMLAIARVAGETAPLLFTALGSRLLTLDPSQPFPSLTVQIYTYATGPYPEQKRLAWAGILVLIFLIFLLNLAIRFTTRTRKVAA